jgi:hypothetical protein
VQFRSLAQQHCRVGKAAKPRAHAGRCAAPAMVRSSARRVEPRTTHHPAMVRRSAERGASNHAPLILPRAAVEGAAAAPPVTPGVARRATGRGPSKRCRPSERQDRSAVLPSAPTRPLLGRPSSSPPALPPTPASFTGSPSRAPSARAGDDRRCSSAPSPNEADNEEDAHTPDRLGRGNGEVCAMNSPCRPVRTAPREWRGADTGPQAAPLILPVTGGGPRRSSAGARRGGGGASSPVRFHPSHRLQNNIIV